MVLTYEGTLKGRIMKKIIEGLRYDTETAEEIASASYLGTGDFQHYSEKLYRTKNGRWFLAGSGGPMSRYARSSGNGTSGGSDIIPLESDDAQDWLEGNAEWDILEAHFASSIREA